MWCRWAGDHRAARNRRPHDATATFGCRRFESTDRALRRIRHERGVELVPRREGEHQPPHDGLRRGRCPGPGGDRPAGARSFGSTEPLAPARVRERHSTFRWPDLHPGIPTGGDQDVKAAADGFVRGAWTTDLRLLEARSALSSATEVDVGGRRGFIGQMPGGPRFQSLTVVYDGRTIVTLAGDGLSPDQLLSAAASLAPADASVAPDVRTEPGKCDRLGMCG